MHSRDILMAVAVPIIWGLGFAAAKIGVDQFPPIFLMAMRFSLTALVLVWFVTPPKEYLGRICLIALISATLQYGLTFYGLKGLDASTAVLVIQLEVPFLALIAAVFLGERVGRRRIVGMALAFGGVIMIAGEPRLEGNYFYILLTMGGAFTWAIGQVMIRRLGGAVNGVTLIAWVSVMSAPQLFLASYLIEDGQVAAMAAADWRGWSTVVYLGLVMTAFGYSLWYHLLGRCEVNQVAPFLLLLPVTTVIAAVLLLGEELTTTIAGGGAIVIAGLAIMTITRLPGRKRRPMLPPV